MEMVLYAFLAMSLLILIVLFFECFSTPWLIFIIIPLLIIDSLVILYMDSQSEERIMNNEEPGYFETEEEALNYNELGDYGDNIGLEKVGEKLEFDFMSVNTDNEYKIGYNGNDDLKWKHIGKKTDYFKIQVTENIQKNYIERVGNKVVMKRIKGKTYYKAQEQRYIFYLKSNSITGGDSREDCGKNCVREINTEIVK